MRVVVIVILSVALITDAIMAVAYMVAGHRGSEPVAYVLVIAWIVNAMVVFSKLSELVGV